MHGFYNLIITINLSEISFKIEKIPDDILKRYLGGKGLATWLLYERNPEGVDPLSSENHLIFATGSVTGGTTWGASRYGVFTKSPLTGLYAESYSGGRVPEAVSATGFDAIIIKGKANGLKIIEVTPAGVLFHDAENLKGKDTFETEVYIKKRCLGRKKKNWKKGSVVIGPAGENGVAFSIIKNDGWRCAGRAGTGTVLGSKNIKGIIFSGDKKREVYDPKGLLELSKDLAKEAKDNPLANAYKSMGTSQMVKTMNNAGAFPTKYWSKGKAAHWEKISSDALHKRCEVKPHACAKCYLSCGRMTKILKGRHKGLVIEGPEYETIFAFGGLCMISSIEEIAYLNNICDSLGMDTITAGNLCAFAMKAYETGKSGFKITFGDADKTAELLKHISKKEGVGEILAKGIKKAAKEWNMVDDAVHVKGMEPAGYDPRVLKGMALSYATSDRGACHLRSTFYKPELAGMIDPDQIDGKAEMFIDFEDRLTIFDTFILCRFFRDLYPWELLETLITASTGLDGSKENLTDIAKNISDKVRSFNLREGMTESDEKLPNIFYRKLEDSGKVLDPDYFNELFENYKKIRGW
ncbi:MAG: aldehyde ferredoxin oxidoreductase family protein [Deltaproteobacteria bacterium]|nr:aldehyde ferredoxin oxidoreductase family protein [Deltaproteobacteria bacterium]